MAKLKCPKCSKVFKGPQGLAMHHKRKTGPRCQYTKKWGSPANQHTTPSKPPVTRAKHGRAKDMLRHVLTDHPEGLKIKDIIAGMKRIGYRSSGDAAGYVSTTAAGDPGIVRVERGKYRLKQSLLEELRPVAQLVVEEEVAEMPREALLLRIEQLTRETKALRTAHMTFVQEIASE